MQMHEAAYTHTCSSIRSSLREPFHPVLRLSFEGAAHKLGWIAPKTLPEHGLAYLVAEYKQGSSHSYKIFAYLDKSGRLFDCKQSLSMPPAQTPLLMLKEHPLYPQEGMVVVPQKELAERQLHECKEPENSSSQAAVCAYYFSEHFPFELQRPEQDYLCVAHYRMLKKTKRLDKQEFSFNSKLLDKFIQKQELATKKTYSLAEFMLLAYLTVLPDFQSTILAQAYERHELKEGAFFELIRTLKERQSFGSAQEKLKNYVERIEQSLESPDTKAQAHEVFFMQLIKEYGLHTGFEDSKTEDAEMDSGFMSVILMNFAQHLSNHVIDGEIPDIHLTFIEGNSPQSPEYPEPFRELLQELNFSENEDELFDKVYSIASHTAKKAQERGNSIALTNSENNQLYLTVLSQHAYHNHKLLFWSDKLECALNRTILALLDAHDPSSLESLSSADWYRFTHITQLAPTFSKTASTEPTRYESWEARLKYIKSMRSYALPHRSEFQLRFDISMRKALIHLWGPPLSCIGSRRYLSRHKLWWNNSDSERNIFQSYYLAQLSALAAATLFSSSPHTEELCIQLYTLEEDLGQANIGVLHISRDNFGAEDLARLNQQMNYLDFFEKFGVNIVLSDKILTTVEGSYDLNEAPFDNSLQYYLDAHLPKGTSQETAHFTTCPIPQPYQKDLGAKILADLAMEQRVYLKHPEQKLEIEDFAFAGTHELVAKLLELQKDSVDPFTHEVFEELICGLVSGDMNFENEEELNNYLLSGGKLGQAVEAARLALAEHNQPEEALELLYPILQDIEDRGLYQDDDQQVWRVFSHYSERILYNLEHHDDQRKLRLVSENLVNAYNIAAHAFILLEQYDDARACISRALVMAPYAHVIHGLLSRVNLAQGKTLAIEKHSRSIFEQSLNPALLTIGYAQLAIVFGKQRRTQEAMSCSALAQEYGQHSGIFPEHLKNDPYFSEHRKLISPADAKLVLRKAGFEAAPRQELLQRILRAAVAASSCGLFPIAADLVQVIGFHTDAEWCTHMWESLSS